MHRHQHEILCRLASLGPERYAAIKPDDLEGNVFVYHLRALMRQKLVKKEGLQYALTSAGMEYVDRLSNVMRQPRIQPKVVTLTACQNHRGQWLFYRRGREPFRNKVGFPYGKVHLGERLQEAAERELLDKTGLTASLKHLGEAYISAYHKKELVSHMLCHVFRGDYVDGDLCTESSIGACFWANPDTIPPEERFPGFSQLLALVEYGKPFVLQEIVEVS